MNSTTMPRVEDRDDLPVIAAGAHIHIVGIGGSGMSAIARVLLEQGVYRVSGSDRNLSAVGWALGDLGVEVYDGHRADHIGDADIVVTSSAIPADNPEVQAAQERGIPVLKRPQALAWLTAPFRVIGVAGTHGKTTTTAMIAEILLQGGFDPSFIIGGVLPGLGTNGRAGCGRHFVIEADEYDRTFLALKPTVAVVTNVEMDHPDCYPTYDDVQAAFAAYLAGCRGDGLIVACADDPGVCRLLAQAPAGRRVVRYGLGESADVRALAISPNGSGHDFDLVVDGEYRCRFSLAAPGLHNVRNALAALSVARELAIPDAVSRRALESFTGVARRFEVKGEAAGVTVIDDYAHHPTEIRATLAAARARYDGRTIWAVFQPHTFSRTLALLDEYRHSFADADHVLITPIYAARERDAHEVSSADLTRDSDHRDMRCVPDLRSATEELARNVRAGDIVLTLGAGDGYQVGEGVLSILREKEK